MEPIKIGSTVPVEKIHNIIEKFSYNKSLNINYQDYNDRYEYIFSLSRKDTDRDIALYNVLANFVQDIFLDFYADKIIKHRTNKIVRSIDGIDKSKIIEEVKKALLDRKQLVREREELKSEILNYLIENNGIIIDGYLTFRPKAFYRLVDKAIETTVEKVNMLIEYNEYIDTLQIFVDGQYSQIDLVNLVVTKDKMELLDAFQKEINNSEVKALLDEVFDEDISEGDLILSSLLALAPKKIIIHGDELDDSEIILVIKEIFLDRVKTCSGCNLCRLNSIGVKKTES